MKFKSLGWLMMVFLMGCSSSPEVQRQDYATLPTEWTFEQDLKTVWRGIEKALSNQRIAERDPGEVAHNEWSSLRERTIQTGWIYGRSNEKFITYQVNGFPKKKYLQVRYRYYVKANTEIGGTHVSIEQEEEVQRLDDEGKPDGYETSDEPDASRGNRLLKNIELALLSG